MFADLKKSLCVLARRALWLLERRPVRLLFAVLVLAAHLGAFQALGRERFKTPFNAEPKTVPAFHPADQPVIGVRAPAAWNRLLPARWDSQHYAAFALRGYQHCPPGDLRGVSLPPMLVHCGFNFYPGYPFVASLVMRATGAPVDYALLGVSLFASLIFLYLATSKEIRDALGTGTAYLTLILLSTFTTGFTLVTMQTEPLVLAAELGAYVLYKRGWLLTGALVAGSAGAMRVSGGAIGLAYAVMLLVHYARAKGSLGGRFARLFVGGLFAGWGQLTLFAFFYAKYKDPLLYVHAHQQAYAHGVSLLDAVWPDRGRMIWAMGIGRDRLHEGVFLLMGLVWLGLGFREAMKRFALTDRVYWFFVLALTLGISVVGSAGLAYAGMNRYWFVIVPLFFSMAVVLKRKPVALAAWMAFTTWHYWNVDLCGYMGQHAPHLCGWV